MNDLPITGFSYYKPKFTSAELEIRFGRLQCSGTRSTTLAGTCRDFIKEKKDTARFADHETLQFCLEESEYTLHHQLVELQQEVVGHQDQIQSLDAANARQSAELELIREQLRQLREAVQRRERF